jgi:hypothetical protein
VKARAAGFFILVLFSILPTSCGEIPVPEYSGVWGASNVWASPVGANADIQLTIEADGDFEIIFYDPPGTFTIHDNSARGTYIERNKVFELTVEENHLGGSWTALDPPDEHRAIYDLKDGQFTLIIDYDLDGYFDDMFTMLPY